MAVYSGADPATCIPPLSYFDGDNSNPPFGYYYRKPLIRDRSHLSVFHCVAVSSNRASSQLLGYVEYYGLWRAVVLLSDAYEGLDIHACYAVNPLNGEKVQLEFVLDLARDELDATLRGEPIPAGALQDALNTVMPIVQTRSHEREQDRVIDDAVRYALANSGLKWGDNITPDYVPTISNLFAQRVMPFLQHIGWDWRKAAAAQRGNRK